MENKGMFTGCGDVIRFTAQQNIKGNGFKKSTIIVGVVIAIVFGLISVLMAVLQDDDSNSNQNGDNGAVMEIDNESLSQISKILLVDNEALDDEIMGNLLPSALTLEGLAEKKLTVELANKDNIGNMLNEDSGAIAVELKKNEEGLYTFDTYVKNEGTIDEDIADVYMGYAVILIESSLYQMAGVSPEDIICMESPYFTQSLAVGEEAESLGVMLTQTLVPMIFSFAMYAMILMYGQSITKSVISEKASKLMEYILTSIKPYALISGKVIALSGMAILQISIWIVCGIGGYIGGTYIAEGINPDYINYVSLIMDFMGNDGGAAFSIGAIILSIVSMFVGFIMYSILAALVASAISKIEDMSSSQGIFQLPVILGWMFAYLAPVFESEALLKIVNFVPVTSPFILPANILLGNCTIVEGLISLAILLLTMFALIVLTGRVYKGKLFNRK